MDLISLPDYIKMVRETAASVTKAINDSEAIIKLDRLLAFLGKKALGHPWIYNLGDCFYECMYLGLNRETKLDQWGVGRVNSVKSFKTNVFKWMRSNPDTTIGTQLKLYNLKPTT